MKFMLRLLLLIVIGTYLYDHLRPFMRQEVAKSSSAGPGELLRHVPTLVDTAFAKSSKASGNGPGYLPRRDLTPGAIDPRVTQADIGQTICRRGYTKSLRPAFEYTNRVKHRVMKRYGVTGNIHDYELDHLIPLELGGCPDCETNLWPQPKHVFPGAKEKDEVEDHLRRAVCAGRIPLAKAQKEIASDWYAVYKHMHSREGRKK